MRLVVWIFKEIAVFLTSDLLLVKMLPMITIIINKTAAEARKIKNLGEKNLAFWEAGFVLFEI